MWLLCVTAHQPEGVLAAEALALYQTANPAADVDSTVSEAKYSAPFSKTSTWTGLVNLDKIGSRSIAGTDNSSEISEEHVVIHLRPNETWDDKPVGLNQEDSDDPKSSNAMGLSDLESLESHGGSAHEEEDGGYLESSDTPTLAPAASSTSQSQTSNSVLAEFVNTLMRPFRSWTKAEETDKSDGGLSVPEEKERDNQTQGATSIRNLTIPKASENKGSMDNAIMEHRSGMFSLRAPSTGLQSPEEGLSEQEKEVLPLIRLVPAVQHTGQSDTTGQPGEPFPSISTDNPPSTVDGTSFPFITLT